jgi:hypothetical protein
MDKQISKGLRNLFFVHAIVGAIFGIPLFLFPGRFLTLVGWRPEWVELPPLELGLSIPGTTFVDPVTTRLLGAAMIALAFSSLLGWRASDWSELRYLVALEAIFCVLGVIGILIPLPRLGWTMPTIGWVTMILLAIFAMAWVVVWWQYRTE